MTQLRERVGAVQALRIGERAAWHGSPLTGVPVLRDLVRRTPDEAHAGLGWLLGVCLGASGRYGAAIEVLAPIAAARVDPCSASLASSTLGSLYRQLGRHTEGRGLDQQALDLVAPVADPGVALVEARLGLAADAVGLRDLPRADAELGAALLALPGAGRSRLAAPTAWRVRARSCWVRAEVALLHGDASQALVAARESVRLARAGRSVRHEAKGLLFASVCEAGIGRPDAGAEMALNSMRLSVRAGAWPLVWPAAIVLSDLLPPGERLALVLELGVLSVELITAGLPEPLAGQWRAGADVQRLLDRAGLGSGA